MAETERQEQSLSQEQGASSLEKDMAQDPTDVKSEPTSEEPVGVDKSQASGGEVMSLKECCREAFGKITEYLNGELASSLQDYILLEKLNKLTVAKYNEMSDTAKTLITVMEELDKKYKSLEPYLEQIDKVEESVASLEQAAYRLDAYSKRLAIIICLMCLLLQLCLRDNVIPRDIHPVKHLTLDKQTRLQLLQSFLLHMSRSEIQEVGKKMKKGTNAVWTK